MRTTTNQFRSGAAALAFMALAVVATTFSACQSTEEGLDAHPQGSIPLVVGTVTVGTPATVGTRVAIGEDTATGYTGIRKTSFVVGDKIELQVTDASGGGSTVETHTITLDGSSNWTFDRTAFVQSGSTMTATYTPAAQAGIPADNLSATTDPDGGITLTGGTLTLGLKHAGAMIDVTPVSGGATITSVTLNDDIATVEEEADAQVMHYRTIVAAGSAISTITADISGIKYVATLAASITPEANKCYPIKLTFKNGTLTATANAPQDWTDGEDINAKAPDPADYERIIDTPEALAQFAYDVNATPDGTARADKVLQTANIDMSQLKSAEDANTAAVGGKTDYNYEATSTNWVPIGIDQYVAFKGSYNGNGFTISNMEMTTYPSSTGTDRGQGFFGCVSTGAKLTGIHLRDFKAVESTQTFAYYVGALAGYAKDATISLCSATGELKGVAGQSSQIGGLIGGSIDISITRCTSRVNVTVTSTNSTNYIGGFGGNLKDATVVSCSSVSALDITGTGAVVGGFCGVSSYSGLFGVLLGCYAGGTMTAPSGGAFCGVLLYGTDIIFEGCYSDVTGDKISDFVPVANYYSGLHIFTDCAWVGAEPSPKVLPVSYGVAPADAYAVITNDMDNLGGSSQVTTLHWSAADGYTLNPVPATAGDKTWRATGIWKNNLGALPTINLAYEGE